MVTQRANQATNATNLLDLGGRLVGEFARLLDQHLALLKAELKQEAAEVARSLWLVIVGAVGACVGAVLLLTALSVWVGDLIGSRPAGLAIVGGALGLLGGTFSLLGARGLGRQRLVPQTIRELQRNAEWIRHEA